MKITLFEVIFVRAFDLVVELGELFCAIMRTVNCYMVK